jgi:hypothetical protein
MIRASVIAAMVLLASAGTAGAQPTGASQRRSRAMQTRKEPMNGEPRGRWVNNLLLRHS